jgi:MFS family permease
VTESPEAVPAAPAVRPHGGLPIIFAALMLAILLAALDQTIVSTALPTIVGDLGGLSHLSWVVTAYILASTASTPLWGKLGDQFVARRYSRRRSSSSWSGPRSAARPTAWSS